MTDKRPTRVAIVSDQAIYLRGLTSIVMSTPWTRLVGEARNWTEAVQLCRLTQPNLVLLDLKNILEIWPEISRQIHQKCPGIKMILLLRPLEESHVQSELNTDTIYTISRDVSEEEFKAALEHISQEPTGQAETQSSFLHYEEDDSQDEPVEVLSLGQAQAHHRDEDMLTRELLMAGKIQADILPENEMKIAGWDISARLVPARETSGDFYDFIPLTGQKWAVVMADVSDKGMGAALFMALSSSLIRTYAGRFPTLPGLAMSAVSERILSDTRSGMFVTAFFGILESRTGRLVFANAGHPPGFLINTQRGRETVDQLRPTGMALGVSETAQWKQKFVKLAPGDYLILYTDGITEAQNPQGLFFGEDRLLDVVLFKVGCSAEEMRDALLDEIHRFVGNYPQQDDIAVIVIRRDED